MKFSSTTTFILGLICFGVSMKYASSITSSIQETWELLAIWWSTFNLVFWFLIYLIGIRFTDRLPEIFNNTWKKNDDPENFLAGCSFFVLLYRKMIFALTDESKNTKVSKAIGNVGISLLLSVRATLYCSGWIGITYLVIRLLIEYAI